MEGFVQIIQPEKLEIQYKLYKASSDSFVKNSMLFLHGGGTDFMYYDSFLLFASQFFDVYAINLPGSGKSTTLKRYSGDHLLKAVDQVVERLNLSDFIIAGHSFGAGVVSKYLEKSIKPKAALLCAPIFYPVKVNPVLFSFKILLADLAEMRQGYLPEFVRHLFRGIPGIATGWRQYKLINSNSFMPKKKIDVPCIGVVGLADRLIPPTLQLRGFEEFFPNSKVLQYSDFGHNTLLAKKDQILTELLHLTESRN